MPSTAAMRSTSLARHAAKNASAEPNSFAMRSASASPTPGRSVRGEGLGGAARTAVMASRTRAKAEAKAKARVGAPKLRSSLHALRQRSVEGKRGRRGLDAGLHHEGIGEAAATLG